MGRKFNSGGPCNGRRIGTCALRGHLCHTAFLDEPHGSDSFILSTPLAFSLGSHDSVPRLVSVYIHSMHDCPHLDVIFRARTTSEASHGQPQWLLCSVPITIGYMNPFPLPSRTDQKPLR